MEMILAFQKRNSQIKTILEEGNHVRQESKELGEVLNQGATEQDWKGFSHQIFSIITE